MKAIIVGCLLSCLATIQPCLSFSLSKSSYTTISHHTSSPSTTSSSLFLFGKNEKNESDEKKNNIKNEKEEQTTTTTTSKFPSKQLRRSFLISTALAGVTNLGLAFAAPPNFKRIPTQFIAALGDPTSDSGSNAKEWGIWTVDPGPRGV